MDIPRERYDMLVKIYPTEGDADDDDFEPRGKGSLTFLPRGTIGPKCFRRGFGHPVPSRLAMHKVEDRVEHIPN